MITAIFMVSTFVAWYFSCITAMTDFAEIMNREVELRTANPAPSLVNGPAAEAARVDFIRELDDFYDKVSTMVQDERNFRLQLFIYPVIVMLRLFKSFNAQP